MTEDQVNVNFRQRLQHDALVSRVQDRNPISPTAGRRSLLLDYCDDAQRARAGLGVTVSPRGRRDSQLLSSNSPRGSQMTSSPRSGPGSPIDSVGAQSRVIDSTSPTRTREASILRKSSLTLTLEKQPERPPFLHHFHVPDNHDLRVRAQRDETLPTEPYLDQLNGDATRDLSGKTALVCTLIEQNPRVYVHLVLTVGKSLLRTHKQDRLTSLNSRRWPRRTDYKCMTSDTPRYQVQFKTNLTQNLC